MNGEFFKIFQDYQEISVRYDVKHRAVWCYYNPTHRHCYSQKMLLELRQCQQSIIDYFKTRNSDSESPIRYVVQCSKVPGIFNLGGDLELFSNLIKERDRQQLLDYATKCIDICYLYSVNMHLPITTITLVEGSALGGGFEAALSSNVLIATENAEMGFPEIRFNLFPGMGAYSFLARCCGMGVTERILSSGKIYSARDLYDKGIVHQLGKSGKGVESAEKYMRSHNYASNGHMALRQIRQRYNPLDYQELLNISELWVDSALQLRDKDLSLMARLAKAQSEKMTIQNGNAILRTRQDRRFLQNEMIFPMKDWSGNSIMVDRRKNQDRRVFH
ncbi:MAG: crotonase/enoyl-CoA hydratase family protein [Desulforhopalus sp.]